MKNTLKEINWVKENGKIIKKTNKKLKFIIDETSFFYIKISRPLNKWTYSEFGNIILMQNDEKPIIVAIHMLTFGDVRSLQINLERILIHKEEISPEINEDIGLFMEEVLNERRGKKPYFEADGIKMWSGFQYKIWGNPRNNITWLYMKDEIIHLEVTPLYPWTFIDREPDENYYIFDEFVKNYKPIAHYILSWQTAQEWLRQATELLKIIDDNSARARKAYYAQE